MVLLLGRELGGFATEHLVGTSAESVGVSVADLGWLHSPAGREGWSPGFLQLGSRTSGSWDSRRPGGGSCVGVPLWALSPIGFLETSRLTQGRVPLILLGTMSFSSWSWGSFVHRSVGSDSRQRDCRCSHVVCLEVEIHRLSLGCSSLLLERSL